MEWFGGVAVRECTLVGSVSGSVLGSQVSTLSDLHKTSRLRNMQTDDDVNDRTPYVHPHQQEAAVRTALSTLAVRRTTVGTRNFAATANYFLYPRADAFLLSLFSGFTSPPLSLPPTSFLTQYYEPKSSQEKVIHHVFILFQTEVLSEHSCRLRSSVVSVMLIRCARWVYSLCLLGLFTVPVGFTFGAR